MLTCNHSSTFATNKQDFLAKFAQKHNIKYKPNHDMRMTIKDKILSKIFERKSENNFVVMINACELDIFRINLSIKHDAVQTSHKQFSGISHEVSYKIPVLQQADPDNPDTKTTLDAQSLKEIYKDLISQLKGVLAQYPRSSFDICVTGNINMHHNNVKVMQGIMQSNPVDKYCEEHFTKEQSYSVNMYNKTAADDVKNLNIVTGDVKFEGVVKVCIDEIVASNSHLAHIYIYPFATMHILKYIHATVLHVYHKSVHEKTGAAAHGAQLLRYVDLLVDLPKILSLQDQSKYIMTLVVQTSNMDICICMCHDKNILNYNTITYPEGKSLEYVFGFIDQSLSDMWLKIANYMKSNSHLQKHATFILPSDLCAVMSKNPYDYNTLYVATEDLLSYHTGGQKHQANEIMRTFLYPTPAKSYNKELYKCRFYSKVNLLISYCLFIVLTSTLSILGYKYSSILSMKKDIQKTTKLYLDTSQRFRELAPQFDYVNINELSDVYMTQKSLSADAHKPKIILSTIEQIVRVLNENDKINIRSIALDSAKGDKITFKITIFGSPDGVSLQMMKLAQDIKNRLSYDESYLATVNHENKNVDQRVVDISYKKVPSNIMDVNTNVFELYAVMQ